jgi:hypothetical protein
MIRNIYYIDEKWHRVICKVVWEIDVSVNWENPFCSWYRNRNLTYSQYREH